MPAGPRQRAFLTRLYLTLLLSIKNSSIFLDDYFRNSLHNQKSRHSNVGGSRECWKHVNQIFSKSSGAKLWSMISDFRKMRRTNCARPLQKFPTLAIDAPPKALVWPNILQGTVDGFRVPSFLALNRNPTKIAIFQRLPGNLCSKKIAARAAFDQDQGVTD
jgi:hypothetical protein